MQQRTRIAAVLLIVAVLFARSDSALAIVVPPASWVLANGDAAIVENGVLLFRFEPSSYFQGGVEPELAPTVTDSMGQVVDGTTELLLLDGPNRYGIFRPSMPLSMPGGYTAINPTSGGGMFMTTAAATLDPPMPSFVANVDIQQMPVDSRCCAGAAQFSSQGSCLAVRRQEVPQLSVSITLAMDDSVARQFLYRVTMKSPMEATPTSYWVPPVQAGLAHAFVPASRSRSYCYTVEAVRITDGEMFTLHEGCEADALGTLGETQPSEDEITAALGLFSCSTPPLELTQAWCDVNRAMCTAAVEQANCLSLNYATTCAAFPPSDMSLTGLIANIDPPSGSAAGSGGASDASGAGGAVAGSGGASGMSAGASGGGVGGASGASGTSGAAGMTNPVAGSAAPSSAGSSGGCTVARVTARAADRAIYVWPVLGILAMLGAGRARRSQRR